LATGITREVLGDIITGDKSCLIAAAEIGKYLIDNLTRIGKYNVQIRQIERLEAAPTDNYRSASIIVPGLRLDAVLSKSLALSRGRSQELIRAGAVKVNGEVKLSQHYLCKEADLLSVRRFGRILIGEITGKTKKNNLILNIKKTI
jgi:RNA-binding protein YlmH